ncbi:MAG: diguanylate cyclase (GGDEF)-like protein [Oleispira sp.]|jgi:diguanylate cyclase (GGDEF)-like protein
MHWLYSLPFLFFASTIMAGPKVLLLNSYHPQYHWTQANNQGIQQVLSSKIADDDLYIEYMDSRRINDNPIYRQALVNLYQNKYSQLKPDIIISTDDYALDFLVEYRDEIFPGTPVVYNGVNFDPTKKLAKLHDFVGIIEGEAIAENLQLIAQLHKDKIDEIIVLSDKSSLGTLFAEKVLLLQKNWNHPEITLTLQDDFSFEEILYQVNHQIPYSRKDKNKSKAYFLTVLNTDNQDRYFSYNRDIPILTHYSKAPIYGMWGTPFMGLGIIGGYMNNPLLHGQNTARIALDILSGTDPASIAKNIKSQYLPRFDNRQIEKFNLKIKNLPNGSEINFKPKTFYSRFSEAIIIIVIITSTLTAIIVLLSAQIRRRKQAENQLAQLNHDLEDKIAQRTLALENTNRALLKLNTQMENLANTDDLTLIPNRRHGHRILDRLSYSTGGEYCIALIDIDHFKHVNDRYGHDIGDQALQFISHTVNQFIRPSDTICRWGGEEFLLIMPETQLDDAFNICERIRSLIATTPIDPIESITISTGVCANSQANTINELLRQADLALYQAKTQGRNRCIAWDPDTDQLKRPLD